MRLETIRPAGGRPAHIRHGDLISTKGDVDAEVLELEAKAGGQGSLSILLGADYGWKTYARDCADKKDDLLAQIDADIASTFTSPATKEHGLGWMTKTQWEETLKTLMGRGVLKAALPADDVFTDKFLAIE